MTLDFKQLVKDHNLNIKGIIQLGTHYWQERETFVELGIKNFVLVEPQRHAYNTTELRALDLKRRDSSVNFKLFNCAVSDEEGEMEMICDEDNQGQSSSLLQPKEHLKNCPWVHFTKKEKVQVKMLDNLEFDRSKYNGIVADLQGAELMAFKGGFETLKTIDFVYCEVNFVPMYEGCALVEELDFFLSWFGFKRVATGKDFGGWTDALYIKK
jgi:FkbM family methyltransferase